MTVVREVVKAVVREADKGVVRAVVKLADKAVVREADVEAVMKDEVDVKKRMDEADVKIMKMGSELKSTKHPISYITILYQSQIGIIGLLAQPISSQVGSDIIFSSRSL